MRPIEGDGTPEAVWLPWLAATPWPPARPPREGAPGRAVVLAAHPDDEVLGAGGLLHLLGRAGWRTDVVWASDGEGSHPSSTAVRPAELARRRRQESALARRRLGLRGTMHWLGLPDSGLAGHAGQLEGALGVLARGADLLLAPWREDGHPDHEACGRAAAAVATRQDVPLWELPVWAWHWGHPDELGPRWRHAAVVALDAAARDAKAAAVAEFTSQLLPLGPDPADRAVLPEPVLRRFARPAEVVLCSPPCPGGGAR